MLLLLQPPLTVLVLLMVDVWWTGKQECAKDPEYSSWEELKKANMSLLQTLKDIIHVQFVVQIYVHVLIVPSYSY